MYLLAAAPVQHWYTNTTFIGIAVGAAVSIIIASLFWHLGVPRALLEYGMPVSKALVSRSPGLGHDDLQVTFRGKTVRDPYLATLHLANRGRRDIRSDDFDKGKPLVFPMEARVIEILSTSKTDEQLFGCADEDKICLFPLLFERRREISVDVLTEGKPRLSVIKSLADTNIERASAPPSYPRQALIIYHSGLASAFIGALALVAFKKGGIAVLGFVLFLFGLVGFIGGGSTMIYYGVVSRLRSLFRHKESG